MEKSSTFWDAPVDLDESPSGLRASTPVLPDTTTQEDDPSLLSLGIGNKTAENLWAVTGVSPPTDWLVVLEDSVASTVDCHLDFSGSIAAWDQDSASHHTCTEPSASLCSSSLTSRALSMVSNESCMVHQSPPTLAMIVWGARSDSGTQSPIQVSHNDSILPSCVQTQVALDLSYKPSFRFVKAEWSHLAVSQSDDPVLQAFFDGSTKWLYLNKKSSCGHKIALRNEEAQLLDEFLHSLLSAGIIVKCKRNGFISYPFFRAKPCGQPRMLIDFSHLRGSTRLPKFCLPSFLSQLRSHPKDLRSWWAVRIDLKDAFYSVALPRRLQPITNFRAGNSTFQFRALPMGLPFSLWILQRVVNSRLNKLRKSFPLLFLWAHVDNIILAANTCEQCKSGLRALIHLLNDAGFYISWKKSQVFPMQCISYCGLSLNFSGGQFNVQEAFRCLLKETLLHTSDKVDRRVLLQLLHQNHRQSKYWQQLLGRVTYLLYTIGLTSAFRWWTMTDATRLVLA